MKQPSHQLVYQRRNKVKGFCVICPNPAAIRRIYDPDTGLVIHEKPMVHCATHWLYHHKRYHVNTSSSKRPA